MAILTNKEIKRKTENYISQINYHAEEIEYNNEEIEEMYDFKREIIYMHNKNTITNLEMRLNLFEMDQEILDIKEDTIQNELYILIYKTSILKLQIIKKLILTNNNSKQRKEYMLELRKLEKSFEKSKRVFIKKIEEIYSIDEQQSDLGESLEEECMNNSNKSYENNIVFFIDEKYKHEIKTYEPIEKIEEEQIDNKEKKQHLAKVLQFKNKLY